MWSLHILKVDSSNDWQSIGNYATLNEISAEIIRRENLPVSGLFLQMHTEANSGNDEEFLSLFIYDGKDCSYTVKKSRH